MRRALLFVMVLLAGPALSARQAGAQGSTTRGADEPKGQNAEGEYGGVQPGQSKKPEPNKKAKKPPPKGTLSWIGFESKDGGSDVFFQSVAPFEVSQRVDNGTLVVALSLSRLGQNTWRPIDTRYFDTSLARVTAKKKGKGIEVRIAFKDPKSATQGSLRTATEADGMYYAYLSFAGGGGGTTGTSDTSDK